MPVESALRGVGPGWLPVACSAPSGGRGRAAVGGALLLVAALAGASQAAPGTYISAADAVALDYDGDGLFDVLNVSVTFTPPAAGGYNVGVTLAWPTPATPTPITSKNAIFNVLDSQQHVTLSLEGPRIREKGLNGPYELQVTLLSSPQAGVDDFATFATPALLASDFASGPDTGKPRIVWGESDVTLASSEIRATVNLTGPRVAWGPVAPAASPGRFAVSFPSLVAFDDADGDGALAGGEQPLCTAPVGSEPWALDTLDIGPSPQWGSYIEFRLMGPVLFTGAPCGTGQGGNVSLTFLLGQHNGTVMGPSPFTLVGGLEVKVDVAVALDAPLPGQAIALEVTLEDMEANSSFRMRGPAGFELVDGRNTTVGQEPLDPPAPQTPETVAFTDDLGAAVGHFSWVPVATQRLSQGQERFVEVTASRGAAGALLRLFLAVPNDPDVVAVSFDPALGLPPPASLPQAPPDGGPEPPRERPSLTIFAAALAAVAAIFFFSVYARAKKY